MPEKLLHLGTNSVLPFLSSIKFEVFESNEKKFKITIIIKYILACKATPLLNDCKTIEQSRQYKFFPIAIVPR